MPPRSTDVLGRFGEDYARRWLEQQGYTTLATNWRCPTGELDIVMLDKDCLVFVEVKTRRGERMGAPDYAVTPAKARKLLVTAQHFVYQHPDYHESFWRIDLAAVAVDPHNGDTVVRHYPNAFVES